jgi:hypothetical protein
MADNKGYEPEIAKYRKEPRYKGYEDYSGSGRAAMEKYNEEEAKLASKNNGKIPDLMRGEKGDGTMPYSKSAAESAQAKQREVMNERRRETKDTVPEERLKKGGSVKSSASRRGDGCVTKGKTKGKMISMSSGGKA